MSLPEGWCATGWQAESGQAWVYQVRRTDTADNALYALKRLKNPARRERFVREVEAMDRLLHEHMAAVPPLIDRDLDADRPWFVMPWYGGGSLEDAVEDQRFRSEPLAGIKVLVELATALAGIHAAGLAHRDIKPANVLLGDDELVVTDFGLCIEMMDENQRVTANSEAVGSRLYIAPENEAGINPDQDQRPADFYAFGKLTWALLAGLHPLPRERVLESATGLVATLDDPRLAPIDGLLRDLLNPDPRARLDDWAVVVAEFQSVERSLRGIGARKGFASSEHLLAVARRVQNSPTVQASLQRRTHQQEHEAWFRGLMTQLHQRARGVELPLGDLNRALGDVLTLAVTTGSPASREQLAAAGVDDDRFFSPSVLGATDGAVCLLVHSQQGIEGFPTIVLRVWPAFDGVRLWLLRAPMITPHGALEAIASFLASPLLSVAGPFPPFRQSTIDSMLFEMEETNRMFMVLVEQYLSILDAGQDPSDEDAWHGRTLTPTESK